MSYSSVGVFRVFWVVPFGLLVGMPSIVLAQEADALRGSVTDSAQFVNPQLDDAATDNHYSNPPNDGYDSLTSAQDNSLPDNQNTATTGQNNMTSRQNGSATNHSSSRLNSQNTSTQQTDGGLGQAGPSLNASLPPRLGVNEPSRLTINPPSHATIYAPKTPPGSSLSTKHVTPPEAESDPYAALGMKVGGLRFYPAVEVGGVYSDNVRQTDKRRKHAQGVMLRPSLRIESDWARHSFKASADGEKAFYHKYHDYDATSLNAVAALKFDIRHTTSLTFRGSYELQESPPSDSEVSSTADEMSREHKVFAGAELTHKTNRVQVTARAGANWDLFEDTKLTDGTREDNKDRNYIEPTVGLRLGYEADAVFSPFVEAGYAPRIHQSKRDRSGLKRNSDGIYGLAGVVISPSAIWDGSVALRYDYRNYDDAILKSVSGVGFDVALNWRPTALTTMTLTGKTGIDDTTDADSSGIRRYSIGLRSSYFLRENIEWTSGMYVDIGDYVGGSGGTETTLTSETGLVYKVNRHLDVVGNYHFEKYYAGSGGRDYREHRFDAGVRFKL